MAAIDDVITTLEKLTGQAVPFPANKAKLAGHDPFAEGGIGYNQLNELLLTLGYDRVLPPFFDYLFRGEPAITSAEQLERGVDQFRKHAMLLFGNVKFGFKTLSALSKAALREVLRQFEPVSPDTYAKRPGPVHKIEFVPSEKGYYLGYIVERELKERLEAEPDNEHIKEQLGRLEAIRRIGRENHDRYLTYDYMDVYIATSMRERHEFFLVSRFVTELFNRAEIEPLRLRWFDPTQAYCEDRIDKGLVEGLMVKRAKCTIYHVQETDTLGKDSELAATLAQGKPVIGYIPRLKDVDSFKRDAVSLGAALYPDQPIEDVLRSLLPRYYPDGAWMDPKVQEWVTRRRRFDVDEAIEFLFEKAQAMYERRAQTLIHSHPLGLQVNLGTGVANGVLVVRTVEECARLLRNIMLNTLEFDIEERKGRDQPTLLLRERISGCVFRVVTGDKLLTNSFWNFYLEERERTSLSAGQRLKR